MHGKISKMGNQDVNTCIEAKNSVKFQKSNIDSKV